MWRNKALTFAAVLQLGLSASGCETLTDLAGMFSVAKDATQNLEKDMAAPLTEQRVSKVLKVIPELTEFQKEAKVKWRPDRGASSMAQFATNMGGLAEYVSFFESHDTRLTQFSADFIKIADARARLELADEQGKIREKLEKEKIQLETQLKDADDKHKARIQRKLDRNQKSLEKLETMKEASERFREKRKNGPKNPSAAYTLSDDEMKLIRTRLPEINKVFQAAGYTTKKHSKH